MPNRRNFITACISGAAWLLGWKGEKPALVHKPMSQEKRNQFRTAWVVTTSTASGVVSVTEYRINRSKPCES